MAVATPENDLRQLFDTYRLAVFNKDLAALLSLYDDDINAFETWGVWVYKGLDAWRRMNEDWFRSLDEEKDVVEFDDIAVKADQTIGFASAIATYSATSSSGSVVRSMQTRLTWVARKTSGQWKIIHQHTSVPIDDQSLKAILRR